MKRIMVAVLLLTSFATLYGGQQLPAPTVLHHVTVINANATPMSDMTILINGGRIAAMDRADAITIPAGAQIIDGRGKFVIPGLMDMHNHLLSGSFPPSAEPAAESRAHTRGWRNHRFRSFYRKARLRA
jgi:imidazolonepropionase-like amidohydrolase